MEGEMREKTRMYKEEVWVWVIVEDQRTFPAQEKRQLIPSMLKKMNCKISLKNTTEQIPKRLQNFQIKQKNFGTCRTFLNFQL